MTKIAGASPELIADHFVSYLFNEFGGARHVRRVASWIGLIVLGIARVSGHSWKVPRKRQLWFEYAGLSFKARYNHKAGPRGGVEIVEVLPGAGAPEGETLETITSLKEAGKFYDNAPQIFKQFATHGHKLPTVATQI